MISETSVINFSGNFPRISLENRGLCQGGTSHGVSQRHVFPWLESSPLNFRSLASFPFKCSSKDSLELVLVSGGMLIISKTRARWIRLLPLGVSRHTWSAKGSTTKPRAGWNFSPQVSSRLARDSCQRRLSNMSRLWSQVPNHVSGSPWDASSHDNVNPQQISGKASQTCYWTKTRFLERGSRPE